MPGGFLTSLDSNQLDVSGWFVTILAARQCDYFCICILVRAELSPHAALMRKNSHSFKETRQESYKTEIQVNASAYTVSG